ncbi:hypothetical protein VKT23_019240 [Stygiomarasmius scandens]|uniref:Uncharacterized protein n=1 Tax=Marasmiellus scandens TaxID=2682957 RepID=A0ABR1IR00_9AGAR
MSLSTLPTLLPAPTARPATFSVSKLVTAFSNATIASPVKRVAPSLLLLSSGVRLTRLRTWPAFLLLAFTP